MTARACLPEPPCDVLDGHRLAGVGLPLGGEGLVEILVELAGRVIGDVEDGRVGECEAEDAELHGAGEKAGKKRSVKAIGSLTASV